MHLVRDPWFPIRTAAIPEHEELSLLGMFCQLQETLGDALQMMARYWLLVTDAYLMSASPRDDQVVIGFDRAATVAGLGVRCQVEFLVYDIVGGVERATGGVRPLDVAIAHPRPRTIGAPPWPAGPELRFDAARTEIVYARAAWDGRLRG